MESRVVEGRVEMVSEVKRVRSNKFYMGVRLLPDKSWHSFYASTEDLLKAIEVLVPVGSMVRFEEEQLKGEWVYKNNSLEFVNQAKVFRSKHMVEMPVRGQEGDESVERSMRVMALECATSLAVNQRIWNDEAVVSVAKTFYIYLMRGGLK